MSTNAVRALVALALAAASGSPAFAEVENTRHDLATPGMRRNGEAISRCSFCHAPHTAAPARAMWSGTTGGRSYKLYDSSTLKATLDQPTGASRVCLSCHDGTIALNDAAARPRATSAAAPSLGTDLSDDHPISFTYDSRLSTLKRELVDPSRLPSTTRLDPEQQLQCTTCHDPHESRNPKFLVADNRASQLCVTCHQIKAWMSSAHATSAAAWNGRGANPWTGSGYKTVAENGCGNCHRVHSAGRAQWLLRSAKEAGNCLGCHSGTTAAKDIEREFRKNSSHPVEQPEWVHTPDEDPRSMSRHVACSDCHDPHGAQRSTPASSPLGALQGVKGVTISGAVAAQARAEYELCYTCHGLREPLRPTVIRRENVANARMEFDPGNASFHPIAAPGRNPSAAGFEPGYSASSIIRCSDCHNGDNRNGVSGPHGSIYEPILEREYQLEDPSPESYQAYNLCYKCHSRTAVLSDRGFPHRKHVVEQQAACASCHDAHGSRRNTHLINFAVRGRTGAPIVSPSRTGLIEFRSLGPSQGQCSLTCHGSDHDARRYPSSPGIRTDAARRSRY
jgi:predicted CXXCH cytochrome family protein